MPLVLFQPLLKEGEAVPSRARRLAALATQSAQKRKKCQPA
jgi:hypothetical protein